MQADEGPSASTEGPAWGDARGPRLPAGGRLLRVSCKQLAVTVINDCFAGECARNSKRFHAHPNLSQPLVLPDNPPLFPVFTCIRGSSAGSHMPVLEVRGSEVDGTWGAAPGGGHQFKLLLGLEVLFFFFFTLFTGPRSSLSLKLSDTRVYEPQIGAMPREGGTSSSCSSALRYPTPYTLRPTPCTLHPTPYTLHLTPYTLHPTQNPTPKP